MKTKILSLAFFSFTVTTALQAQQATTIYNGSNNDPVVVEGREIKKEDLKSKEVSKEINMPKSGEIYIENASRAIVVKTWDQPKVKISTTVYYSGEDKFTDEEFLEKVNISLRALGNSVKIKSGIGMSGSYSFAGNAPAAAVGMVYSYNNSGGVNVVNSNGMVLGTKNTQKKVLVITVPAGSKLDIESKYSDLTLPDGITDVSVDITNGNLEAGNLTKLVLRSKYSNANIGNIKNAELEFTNGRFTAQNIDDLDIESKYSTVEAAAVKKTVIRSTNDEYEIEEVYDIRGRKNYGNLRITQLQGPMDIEGINADIKVRKVNPAVSSIKLDDKYADIRIPLRELKNYSIDFAGTYSSVYGNFEKKEVEEAVKNAEKPVVKEDKSATAPQPYITSATQPTITSAGSQSKGTIAATTISGVARFGHMISDNIGPSRFTATVGDGKGLKLDLKCQNCTVDLK